MPGIPNPDIKIALEVVLIRVNGLSKDGTIQAKKGETRNQDRHLVNTTDKEGVAMEFRLVT